MAQLLIKRLNETAVKYYGSNEEQIRRGDSGYDCYYCGEPIVIAPWATVMLGLGITAAPTQPQGYELWPRSSISKTPLLLANSIGLIDQGYRGEIKACVRNLSATEYTVNPGDKLFQLCMPDKKPFRVEFVVDHESSTIRGDGGFGSTNNK